MKKYLLTLCLTMLGFIASWAQDYRINISGAPIYVEVNGEAVSDPAFPNSREFTIDAPFKTYDTDYTVEAVVAKTNLVTASSVSYNDATKTFSVTFSKGSEATIAKTNFEIVVKAKSGGQELAKTGSIDIYVFDKDNVNQLVAPANQTVGAGEEEKEVPFYFAPVTATLNVSAAAKTGAANTGTLSASYKKNTNGQWVIALDATNAKNGDKYTVTITPQKGVDPVSFDVDVTLPVFPVKYQSTYRTFYVGDKLTSPLEVEVPSGQTWGKGTDYKVTYSAKGVTEGYISIDENGTEKDALNLLKAGKAQVTATYTPQGALANSYSPWEQTLDINILPAYYQYNGFDVSTKDANNTYTVTPGEVRMTSLGTAGHITVNPNDYDIHYYLEGEIPGSVEIVKDADGNIIFDQNGKFQVKVTDPVPSQTFYVMATVTPKDRTNYNGVTARQEIKFAGTQTGAILKKVAEGEWVAYLANPGETGESVFANYTIEGATSETQATLLAEFKAAKTIRVRGVVNSKDITYLAHSVGAEYSSVNSTTPLKTLDFSDCTLVGGFAVDANGSYNGLPVERTDQEMGRMHSFTNVETLILPKPASPNTTLPKDFWKFFSSPYNPQENHLKSLTIPEGWTEVAEGFGCSMSQGNNPALKNLKQLVLANSIEKIGAHAFSGLGVEVLTMPKNIHRIAEYAFAPSPKLQDVYFTGPAPEYVDIFAFDGETQQANNTMHSNDKFDKPYQDITRFEYWDNVESQKVLACIMHYPKQYQSTYIDETREYKEVPWGTNYHPGNQNNQYRLDDWTDGFINNVIKGKRWHSAQLVIPVDMGLRDKYYGESMIWPSQTQMSTGYCIAQAGYQWNGQPLRQADQYQPGTTYDDPNNGIDRRGLYQFIIAMSNGTSDIVFEANKWYTICLPFNMNITQIQEAFGPGTQVCRFSKVTRDVTSDPKTIKLYFRKSVMNDLTGNLDGTNYSDYDDEGHGNTYADEYKLSHKEGIIHHFPYMIKPSGPTSEKYSWHDGEGKWHFDSSLFKEVLSGVLHAENVYANGVKTNGVKYSFVPIMMDNSGNNNVGGIKPNSYIFVNYNGKHQYVFYKGVKKDGVYVAGGKANQNTAYVQMSATDGQNDCDIFFGGSGTSAQNNAKAVKSFFGDDEDDEATEIENVVIICGDDPEPDNKVYTINGVLVNGNNLPAGLYIKNGKKFIVK